MSRKRTRASLAALLSAAVLAGPVAAQDVTLTHDKAPWTEGFDAMGEAAGFIPVAYPPEQYTAFVQSSVAAGRTPDLFTWWAGTSLTDIVESGAVAPVDAVWDEAVASGEMPSGLRDLFAVDGKAYAIPLYTARWVVLYNKAKFAEAGIDEPTTWEEFEAAAAALKAAGITPINATVQAGWRGFVWFQELMIRTHPEAYVGLHTSDVAYDSPEVREVFDIWLDWAGKGWFSDPRSSTEAQDFGGGNAAMYLMGEWALDTITEAGLPVDDIGVFIMPNRDPDMASHIIIEAAPLMLSKTGAENEEALAAYKFWTTAEAAQIWAETTGLFNGNLNVEAPNPIVDEVTAEMAENGTIALTRWWEAVPAEIKGDLVAELSAFVLNPTREQMETTISNLDAISSEYWDYQ